MVGTKDVTAGWVTNNGVMRGTVKEGDYEVDVVIEPAKKVKGISDPAHKISMKLKGSGEDLGFNYASVRQVRAGKKLVSEYYFESDEDDEEEDDADEEFYTSVMAAAVALVGGAIETYEEERKEREKKERKGKGGVAPREEVEEMPSATSNARPVDSKLSSLLEAFTKVRNAMTEFEALLYEATHPITKPFAPTAPRIPLDCECGHPDTVHGDSGDRGCMTIGCKCTALVIAPPKPIPPTALGNGKPLPVERPKLHVGDVITLPEVGKGKMRYTVKKIKKDGTAVVKDRLGHERDVAPEEKVVVVTSSEPTEEVVKAEESKERTEKKAKLQEAAAKVVQKQPEISAKAEIRIGSMVRIKGKKDVYRVTDMDASLLTLLTEHQTTFRAGRGACELVN